MILALFITHEIIAALFCNALMKKTDSQHSLFDYILVAHLWVPIYISAFFSLKEKNK